VFYRSTGERPGAVSLLRRAQHAATMIVAVILGQQGDPSSTSVLEALRSFCWCSTPLGLQVVCPRPPGGCQQRDLLAGTGLSGIQLSELGGDALSLPACGGRGIQELDCFSSFLSRVLYVICRVSSSNSWLVRARDDKGLCCNLYLPCVSQ
jgi:hypothetical protein